MADLYEIEMDSQQKTLGYKEIVMNQFRRITMFFNREFRGGFYTALPTKDGSEKLIYVEDTREVLSNSIRVFAILLKPKFCKEMKQYYATTNVKLKVLKKHFLRDSSLNEKSVLGEDFYEAQTDKILLHEYKNQRLEIYIKLFDKLSWQLAQLKYLQIFGGNF